MVLDLFLLVFIPEDSQRVRAAVPLGELAGDRDGPGCRSFPGACGFLAQDRCGRHQRQGPGPARCNSRTGPHSGMHTPGPTRRQGPMVPARSSFPDRERGGEPDPRLVPATVQGRFHGPAGRPASRRWLCTSGRKRAPSILRSHCRWFRLAAAVRWAMTCSTSYSPHRVSCRHCPAPRPARSLASAARSACASAHRWSYCGRAISPDPPDK
jgi:hypothetical protein